MSLFVINSPLPNCLKGVLKRLIRGAMLLSVVGFGCTEDAGTSARKQDGDGVGTPTKLSENGDSSGVVDAETASRILGLLQSGGFAPAEAAALARLESDPADARARFLLGVARQKQKRYAAGLAAIEESCASPIAFPERQHAGHFRGWCLFYLGRPGEAADAFEDHLEVSPDEADSHFGLGVSRLEAGDPEAARPSFERAIELNDGRPDLRRDLAKAWIRLGDTWWETDRPELARAAYHKGVIQYADHYEGWEKLARTLDRAGDSVKAERARDEARNARLRVGAFVDDAGSEQGDG
jgi:tetratricopeptide (TPR) repeat protein